MKTKLFRNKLLRKTLASWCAFATLATTTAPVFASTDVIGGSSYNSLTGVPTPDEDLVTKTVTFGAGDGVGVIDWNLFNINASDITYTYNNGTFWNIVTGAEASTILGKINGNAGSVYLLNPNGIVFGPTAVVDLGGIFAAAAASISSTDLDTLKTDTTYVPTVFTPGGDITVNPGASFTAPDGIFLTGKNVNLKGGEFINDLTVVAADAVNGGMVTFAVDSSASTGDIDLMGTFTGSGKINGTAANTVKVSDDVTATGKEISLTGVNWFQTAGKKVKADTVKIETTGTGDVALDLVEADTLLKVTTKGDVTQQTGSSITATKVEVTADGDVVLGKTANAIKGIEGSAKSVTLTTTEDLAVTGLDTSANNGDIMLTLGTDKTATFTGTIKAGTGDIETTVGNLKQTGGSVSAQNIVSAGNLEQTAGTITAAKDVTVTGTLTQNVATDDTVASITATAGDIKAAAIAQTLTGGGAATATLSATAGDIKTTTGAITQNGGEMTAENIISATSITQDAGTMTATGKITATNGDITAKGTMEMGELEILNGDMTITDGKTVTADTVTVKKGTGYGTIYEEDGAIVRKSTSGGLTINANVEQKAVATKSAVIGDKTTPYDVTIAGTLTQDGAGSQQVYGDTVKVDGDITVASTVTDATSVIDATTMLNNNAGTISQSGGVINAKNISTSQLKTFDGGTIKTTKIDVANPAAGTSSVVVDKGAVLTSYNGTANDLMVQEAGAKGTVEVAATATAAKSIDGIKTLNANLVQNAGVTEVETVAGDVALVAGTVKAEKVSGNVDMDGGALQAKTKALTVTGNVDQDGGTLGTATDEVTVKGNYDIDGNVVAKSLAVEDTAIQGGAAGTPKVQAESITAANYQLKAGSLESLTGTSDVTVNGKLTQTGGAVQNVATLTVTDGLAQNVGTITATTVKGDVTQKNGTITAATIDGNVLQDVTGATTDAATIVGNGGTGADTITFKNGNVVQDFSGTTPGTAKVQGKVALDKSNTVDLQSTDNDIASLSGSADNAKVATATTGALAISGLTIENNLAVSAASDVTLTGNNMLKGITTIETTGNVVQSAGTTKAKIIESDYTLTGATTSLEALSNTDDLTVKGNLTQNDGAIQNLATLKVTDNKTYTQNNGTISASTIEGNVVQSGSGTYTPTIGTAGKTVTFKNGNVTQTSTNTGTVNGNVVLDNAGAVDLQSAGNDIAKLGGSADTVKLVTKRDIELQTVSATSLELTAKDTSSTPTPKDITQATSTTLTLGTLEIKDANDVKLDNAGNAIGNTEVKAASLDLKQANDVNLTADVTGKVKVTVDAPTSESVTIASANDLTDVQVEAKDVTIDGDKSVTVTSMTANGNAIVEAGTTVALTAATVTKDTLVNAGTGVTLDGANTFTGKASINTTTGNVTQNSGTTKAELIETGTYTLNGATASLESLNTTGHKDLTVKGNLTQDNGAVANVENLTVTGTLTQNKGSITLPTTGAGVGTLTATVFQTDGSIQAQTIDGNVTQAAASSTAAPTIGTAGNAITFTNGDVKQTGTDIDKGTVNGLVSLTNAKVVDLQSANNSISKVSGTADDVTIYTKTGIDLGTLTLLSLVLNAADGTTKQNVTQSGTIEVGALEIEAANNVTLGDKNNKISMAAVTADGNLVLKQQTDVLLSANVGGTTTVEVDDPTKQSATITSDQTLKIADVIAKDVSIAGTKDVTVTKMTAKGDASVSGKDGVAVSAAKIDGSALLKSTAGAVSLDKGTLTGSTVGNGLTVDAKTTATVSDTTITKGDLTVDATGTTSDATLTSVTVSAGDLKATATKDVQVATSSVSGNVDLQAGNDAALTMPTLVGGNVKINAGHDGGVAGAANIVGNVDIAAGNDALVQASKIGGNLDVDAVKTVSLTTLTLTGDADIDAGTGVTLTGVNKIDGSADIATAAGNITQAAGSTLTVIGKTDVTATTGAVTLDQGVTVGKTGTASDLKVVGAGDVSVKDAKVEGAATLKSTAGAVTLSKNALAGNTVGNGLTVDAKTTATVSDTTVTKGGADIDSVGNATLTGVTVSSGDLTVDATGTTSDATLTSVTVSDGDMKVAAGQDVAVGNASVSGNVDIDAGRNAELAVTTAGKNIGGNVNIDAKKGFAQMKIYTPDVSNIGGNVEVNAGTVATVDGEFNVAGDLKATTTTDTTTGLNVLVKDANVAGNATVDANTAATLNKVDVDGNLVVDAKTGVSLQNAITVDGTADITTTGGNVTQNSGSLTVVGDTTVTAEAGAVTIIKADVGKTTAPAVESDLKVTAKNAVSVTDTSATGDMTLKSTDMGVSFKATTPPLPATVTPNKVGGNLVIEAKNTTNGTTDLKDVEVTGNATVESGKNVTLDGDITVDGDATIDTTNGQINQNSGNLHVKKMTKLIAGDDITIKSGAFDDTLTISGKTVNFGTPVSTPSSTIKVGKTLDIDATANANVTDVQVLSGGNADIDAKNGDATVTDIEVVKGYLDVTAGKDVKLVNNIKVTDGDTKVTADSDLNGSGSIIQQQSAAAETLDFNGNVTMVAGDAITILKADVEEAASLTANGGDITVTGTNIGTKTGGGDYDRDATIYAKNNVLLTNVKVQNGGDADIDAETGNVALNTVDVKGNLTADAKQNVTLNNAITVDGTADITAATGKVDQESGSLTVIGNTTVTADAGSVTIIKADVGKTTAPAVESDLTVTGKGGVIVKDVTVTGDASVTSTDGNVSLATSTLPANTIGGSLTVSTPATTAGDGNATISDTIVAKDATVTTGNKATLNRVTVTTGDATVTAGTSVDLNAVTVTAGDLAATANNGDVTLMNTVKVGGDAQLTAAKTTASTGNINQVSGKLEVDGNVSLDAQNNISLGLNNGNYIDGNLTAVAGDNVDLDVIHTLKVDEITSYNGSIDVDVSGAGSQFAMSKATGVVRATAANQTIDISTTGGNITLTKVTANSTTGTVNLNAGGDIAMYNDSRSINEVSANTLNLTATGKVGDTAGSTVGLRTHVNNESLEVAGSATAENDKSLNFSASPTSATGNNVVGGALTQTVLGGDLTQSVGVAVEVTGVTTLVATDNSATVAKEGNIILEETTNDFKNNVNLDTDGYVQIVDTNNLKFDQVTVDGFLEAKSVGANIDQVAGTGVTEVQGRTHLEAAAGVTLDNAGNDFVGNVSVDNAAGNVSLRDKNDISLGDAFYTGTKEDGVVSGGNVTVSTVDGDITLNNLATATTGAGVDYTVDAAANVVLNANGTAGKGNIIQPNQTIDVSPAGYAQTPDNAGLNTSVKAAGDLVMLADNSIGNGEYITVDAGTIAADAGADASIVGIGGMDVKKTGAQAITYADTTTETYDLVGISTGGDADLYTDGTLSTKNNGGLLDIGNNMTVTANAYDRTIDTKLEGSTITVWNIEGHGNDQAAFDLQGGNAHPEVTSTRNNMNVFIDGRYVGGERMNFNQLWNIEAFQMLTPSLDVTYTVDDEGTLTETEEE